MSREKRLTPICSCITCSNVIGRLLADGMQVRDLLPAVICATPVASQRLHEPWFLGFELRRFHSAVFPQSKRWPEFLSNNDNHNHKHRSHSHRLNFSTFINPVIINIPILADLSIITFRFVYRVRFPTASGLPYTTQSSDAKRA